MVVRQGVWMVYGGVEWCMVVEKGCCKVWEMAGMDGGVAAKGIRMMVAAARNGNIGLDEFLNCGEVMCAARCRNIYIGT